MNNSSRILGIISTTALAGITMLSAPAFADTDPQAEIAALKSELQKEQTEIQKENATIQKLMAKVDQLQAQQNKEVTKVDNLQKQQATTEAKAPSKPEPAETTGVHDWSGPYVGANVGAGMASGTIAAKDSNFPSSDSFDKDIVQGGLHAGYNYQMKNTVLGIESEINLGSQNHKDSTGIASSNELFLTQSKTDWSTAILARAGIAMGDTLFFVDAGPALAHLNGRAVWVGQNVSYNDNSWIPGIKGGVGAEFFVAPNVSVRAQFSALALADKTAGTASPTVCTSGANNTYCRFGWTNMQQSATVGVDYHF